MRFALATLRDRAPLLGLCVCLGIGLFGSTGCGKDGSIVVGVVATQPPNVPTLTPVPPVTPTPTVPIPPTATVPPTNTPVPSNCCSEHASPGCDDPVCEACVCDVDPDDFCCGAPGVGGWDASCVEITALECVDACNCP